MKSKRVLWGSIKADPLTHEEIAAHVRQFLKRGGIIKRIEDQRTVPHGYVELRGRPQAIPHGFTETLYAPGLGSMMSKQIRKMGSKG